MNQKYFFKCFPHREVLECLLTGFEIVYRSIDDLWIATTTNYNSPTEPRTPNVTVTTVHIKVLYLHYMFHGNEF
jgi:hypothetical protein